MEHFSRRKMLLVGGAAGASVLGGGALLSSTYAAPAKLISVTLAPATFGPGDRMVVNVTVQLSSGRKVRVTDSTGLQWTQVSRGGGRQVWTATAATAGSCRVTAAIVRSDGTSLPPDVNSAWADYQVIAAPVADLAMIGMSAPSGEWSSRLAEVGTAGVTARRIFADLGSGAQHRSSLIEEAHNAGMMPVVSYKVPSFTSAATGAYDAVATQAANYLASFDKPTAVCVWHEPNSDMTGAQFVALQNRLMPKFKGVGKLKVGPILNGFLLTQPRQGPGEGVNEFTTYTSPALLDLWDYFGIDTYQPGTLSSPNTSVMPAHRIDALLDWLDARGKTGMPIGVGEYNGFSEAAVTGMGEALLDPDSHTLFGCVWNVAEARAGVLTGTRLSAYKATKSDARACQ